MKSTAVVVAPSLGIIALPLAMLMYQRQGARPITPREAEILSHLSLVDMPDFQGITHKTLVIKGVNVQIVTGDDNHYSALQTGNLIIGYPSGAPTGSHNFLQGQGIDVVASHSCMISGRSASIFNSADSVILSAESEIQNGLDDAVVGGARNRITNNPPFSERASVLVGGNSNLICSGEFGAILGGRINSILGPGTGNTISGGGDNTIGPQLAACNTSGDYLTYCSITGGNGNWIHGANQAAEGATISGGLLRQATGDYDWRAGNLFEDQ